MLLIQLLPQFIDVQVHLHYMFKNLCGFFRRATMREGGGGPSSRYQDEFIATDDRKKHMMEVMNRMVHFKNNKIRITF